jgi:biopolymer transport protein TolR
MGADLGGSKDSKSEPNVVPLCDILLVLLIIFMVLTPLIRRGVNVKLPEAVNTQEEPEPGKMVTVYVKKDPAVGIVIYLDDKPVESLDKLTTMIEDRMEETKQQENTKVLLKADSELSYGKVTEIMDEIRRAQIEVVGLVTSEKVASH